MGDEEEPVDPVSASKVTFNPETYPDPKLSPKSGVSGTEECYFCGQRVYVLERISTEGKFFHRSCFTCHQCGSTLRLGGYTFSQQTGRFYCELHSEQLELENGKQSASEQETIGDHTEKIRGVNGISSEEDPPCPSEDDDDDDQYYLDSGPSQDDPSSKQSDHVEEPSDLPQSPIDVLTTKGLQVCVKENERVVESPTDPPTPVPKPRHSHLAQASPPIPKPRTVLLTPNKDTTPAEVAETPSPGAGGGERTPTTAQVPDSRPKQSLKKLKLTNAEKSQLVNLSFSLDSDSETPVSSSCSSSSATVAGHSPPKPLDGPEEEGYWSGGPGPAGHVREHRNRRCFRKKDGPVDLQGQGKHAKVRSKFSPWNLSSPRLGRDHRFSVLNSHPEVHYGHSVSEEDGADGDDDDDDDEDDLDMLGEDGLDLFDVKFQDIPSDPVAAEKMELMKMKTLERRAKTCEMKRFHRAQSIQRRLEEIEVTFKELEDKGVVLERVLRGEEGSSGSPEMIDRWIHLVHQKNALVSEESDLMVASRQLELEDKQSILEMELRQYMELNESEKTPEQQVEEERVLQEMLEVVDMRDSLVSFLEEKRLKEMESDEQEANSLLEAKRHVKASAEAQVHWE